MMENIAQPARANAAQAAQASQPAQAAQAVHAASDEPSSAQRTRTMREPKVYVTERSGQKYYRVRSCRGLNPADEIQRIGLAEARNRGKTACNICYRLSSHS